MKHQLCDIADADIDAQKEFALHRKHRGYPAGENNREHRAIHLWSRSRQFVVGSFLAR